MAGGGASQTENLSADECRSRSLAVPVKGAKTPRTPLCVGFEAIGGCNCQLRPGLVVIRNLPG